MQGQVIGIADGYLSVSVLQGGGVSGGPAINAAGAVVGIASYGSPGRLHLVGPVLVNEFLRVAVPILDSWVRIPAPGQPGSDRWFGQDRPTDHDQSDDDPVAVPPRCTRPRSPWPRSSPSPLVGWAGGPGGCGRWRPGSGWSSPAPPG